MYFLNAETDFAWKTVRATLVLIVDAGLGARESAGRAMVAGMAMAFAAASSPNAECTVGTPCNKHPLVTVGAADGNHGEPADIGFVTMFFTPLHKAVRGRKLIVYDMSVWGWFPL